MLSNFRKTFTRSSAAQRGRARPSSKPAAPEPKKFEWSTVGKFTKPLFIVGGLIYFVRRSMGGMEDDQLNKSLRPANPQKPPGKLIVTRMDDKLVGYDAAFMAAQRSAKTALARKARVQLLKLVDAEFDALSEEQIVQLLELGKQMRQANKELGKSSKMAKELLQFEFIKKPNGETGGLPSSKPVKGAEGDDSQPESTATATGLPVDIPPGATIIVDPKTGHKTVVVPASKDEIMAEQIMMQTLQAKLRNEISLMKNIERILSSKQKSQLMMLRRPNMVVDILSSLIDADPLTQFDFIFDKIHHLQVLPKSDPPKVYVLDFKGDIMATQVDKLREEITGILANIDPKRGDQVILTLNSGGGSVTGYGLASAQLNRLKVAGVPLTVCVDEVAASGGYMMAAVADKIVASPFAILGSVGVITTVPNFSSRLLREGVEVEDITAGKYKRTLTPYKKSTPEDRAKTKSDIEDVFALFKDFLKTQRPRLDVEKIATGETWFGPDALKRGLCDELQTSDDCILNARKSGSEVYKVELIYQQPTTGLASQLISAAFGVNPFSIDSEAAGDRMEGENTLMYYARKVLTNAAMSYFGNASQAAINGTQGATALPVGIQNVMSQLNTGEEVPVNRRFMAVDESVTGGRGPRF